jgi:hypothetical protein
MNCPNVAPEFLGFVAQFVAQICTVGLFFPLYFYLSIVPQVVWGYLCFKNGSVGSRVIYIYIDR